MDKKNLGCSPDQNTLCKHKHVSDFKPDGMIVKWGSVAKRCSTAGIREND